VVRQIHDALRRRRNLAVIGGHDQKRVSSRFLWQAPQEVLLKRPAEQAQRRRDICPFWAVDVAYIVDATPVDVDDKALIITSID
jgi:hypothetical protein